VESLKFYCDTCGAEVSRSASRCPDCGRIFTSVRCPRCGHSGELSEFTRGCPVCGHREPAAPKAAKAARAAAKREAAPPLPLWVWAASLLALAAALAALFLSAP